MDKYILVYDNGEHYEDYEKYFLCYFDESELDKANHFLKENENNKVLLNTWVEKKKNLAEKYELNKVWDFGIEKPKPPNRTMSAREHTEHVIRLEDWKDKKREFEDKYWDFRKQIHDKVAQEIGPMPVYYNNLEIEKLPHLAAITAINSQ